MAAELGLDVAMARRGALLHDVGKVLTHEHEGTHVQLGVEMATKYGENPIVVNCIAAHHDDVPHESEVSVLVQAPAMELELHGAYVPEAANGWVAPIALLLTLPASSRSSVLARLTTAAVFLDSSLRRRAPPRRATRP